MINRHFRTSRMVKSLLLLSMVVALGAAAVGARRWLGGARPTGATSVVGSPPAQPAGRAAEPPAQLSVELVTITPGGFEPSEINTQKGRFILAVDNRSGEPDVELQLLRETGQKLHEVRVPRELADWSDVVDLHPGRYELKVAGRPEWKCNINVSAR